MRNKIKEYYPTFYILFGFFLSWAFGTGSHLNYKAFVVWMLVGIFDQTYKKR